MGMSKPKFTRYQTTSFLTPYRDERQLHLKVRVMCGQREVVAYFLVDSGAQASLVWKRLFPDTCLKDSDRPVCLKVANGEIMCGGSHEAELGLEVSKHDRLDQPDQAKRLMLQGTFYVADLPYWDIIIGYKFMVSNSARAL